MIEKFISHRGNLYKKDQSRENNLSSVKDVISKGFDCEIDLWLVEGNLFLGHDHPENKIDINELIEIKDNLWIHCKNLDLLNYLIEKYESEFNYFWHQNDDYTLTSKKFIWTFPNKNITKYSVIVDLEHKSKLQTSVFGICSDNIHEAKQLYY